MSKKNKKQLYGIPEKFLERLTEIVGSSYFNQIKQTFVERPTTFRVNTLKAPKHESTEALIQNGFKIRQVQWYKDAFVLLNKSKRELTDLDIYKEGKIYIQSLASMVPPLVLDPKPGEKVLDLTAAPGSKTSQITALMNCEGELVANDNNKVRFFKLKHNMEVLGVAKPHPNPHSVGEGNISSLYEGEEGRGFRFALRMEHGSFLCREYPEYFDKILLDAPCSAETRFIEGEPETYGYWKESKIKEMAYKQRKLLFSAWSALKPGGTLVYSTCTFAPEENELQITRFMEQNTNCELLAIDLPDIKRLPLVKTWPASRSNAQPFGSVAPTNSAGKKGRDINKEVQKKALRIMPTKEIEGFFVVKMRKAFLQP